MKKLITGSVIIVLIIALCAALVHFWDNMYYVQILDRMDCGVLLSDVKIELINEDRGGMTKWWELLMYAPHVIIIAAAIMIMSRRNDKKREDLQGRDKDE